LKENNLLEDALKDYL